MLQIIKIAIKSPPEDSSSNKNDNFLISFRTLPLFATSEVAAITAGPQKGKLSNTFQAFDEARKHVNRNCLRNYPQYDWRHFEHRFRLL